jgi:hypothetical protein
LVTGAKCIHSSSSRAEKAAPFSERRPTAARREILAHRSGSAVERKRKVARGGARRPARGAARVSPPSASARAGAGAGQKRHFFLAMEKKWPHSAEKSGK